MRNSYASLLLTRAGVAQGSLVTGPSNVRNSYFDRDIAMVDMPASLARSGAELRATTMTGIFAEWDAGDWDFGSADQSPVIKYNSDECQSAQNSNPLCGKILPYQGSLMKRFELLGSDTGINKPFDFATFNDYQIIVVGEQQSLRFIAESFAPQADIVVYKTTTDAEVVRVKSGVATPPIALNTVGNTILDVVVEESTERRSFRYRFNISRLDEQISLVEIDGDDDGLIDIATPDQLSAMRHSLDGSFYRTSADSSPIYCRNACRGYELTADIDLAGIDWQPIGSNNARFNAYFQGNGYVINNLSLNDRMNDDVVGLFAYLGEDARLEDIHLRDASVRSNITTAGSLFATLAAINHGTIFNSRSENAGIYLVGIIGAGALVYENYGRIINSSVVGGTMEATNSFGGFVRINRGTILGSFSTISMGTIRGVTAPDGFSVVNFPGANIEDSYAQSNFIGDVRESVSGLVGVQQSQVRNSYAIGAPLIFSSSGSPQTVDSYWDRDAAATWCDQCRWCS